MLDPSELRQFFPLIVTPSHDGKVFVNYLNSMLNFAVQAERAGMRLQVFTHQGESLVTRARNNCVRPSASCCRATTSRRASIR